MTDDPRLRPADGGSVQGYNSPCMVGSAGNSQSIVVICQLLEGTFQGESRPTLRKEPFRMTIDVGVQPACLVKPTQQADS